MYRKTEIQKLLESSAWDPITKPPEVEKLIEKPDRLMWSSSVSHYSCNWVWRVRFNEQDVEQKIDEILSFYKQRGHRLTWSIGPYSTPSQLPQRLKARGFQWIGTFEGLAMDLQNNGIDEHLHSEAMVEIRPVQTRAELVTFFQLKNQQYSEQSDQPYSMVDYERLLSLYQSSIQQPYRTKVLLLAYMGKDAIGTASYHLSTNGEIIHLAESYVLPQFRKQGVYRMLVDYRIRVGKQENRQLAITQANIETSASILKKLGFQKQCLIEDYVDEDEM